MPIIPDLSSVPGRVNLTAPSLGAAMAQGEALGKLGQSLSQISDTFAAVAETNQKFALASDEFQLRSKWEQAETDLVTKLSTNPDPQARLDETNKLLGSLKNEFKGSNVSPKIRQRMDLQFAEFEMGARKRAGIDATRLTVSRAQQGFKNEFEKAIETNDRARALRALDTSKNHQLVTPEEETAWIQRFESASAFSILQNTIDEDPLDAERSLADRDFLAKNPSITPEARDALQRRAEQRANRYRSDFANDLIISGNQPTPEDLELMEEEGQIDKHTRARWLTTIRNAQAAPQSDPAIYEETYGQIQQYDPAKDTSGRTEANLRTWIASQPLPPEELKALNAKLSDRLNPAISKQPRSRFESSFASKTSTDFTRGDFGKYRFPVDHDGNAATPPITPINMGEYDKAWNLMGRFNEQWRGILSSMPEDVPFEKVNAAYDALKKSFKDQKPMPDLNFSTPPALPFNPDATYKNLPGKRSHFGGIPVKPAGIPYTGASATVFGGKSDPQDNGLSAMGGKTGPGEKEGTAIPQALLAAKFPGKDKKWLSENVRTVVRGADGVAHSLALVDLGTAEIVWERAQRPTLDLTEGAARQLGGKVIYTTEGKLSGLQGLDSIAFSVVSINIGGKQLEGMSWNDAKKAWFDTNRPTTNEQADNGLIALRQQWTLAQANAPTATPERRTGKLPLEATPIDGPTAPVSAR